MPDSPDVSVIMPTWKAGAFVHKAIWSCLASRGVTVEVVAVDDASPDDTFAVLQRIAKAEPRVRIDRLAVNSGPSAARNHAIGLARGRFIVVVDCDDAITQERLADMIALADRMRVDIVFDGMTEVDEHGEAIGDGRFLKSETFASAREIDLDLWVKFNQPMTPGDCIGYLKPLIRREALERAGIRYDVGLRNSEDYYLVAHLLAAGSRAWFTPQAGYRYTRSASSTSHRLKVDQTAAWLRAETDFRVRWDRSLTAQQRQGLDHRWRLLTNVDHFVRSVDAISKGQLASLPGLIASDPASASFTAGMLARIVLGKVLRRKLV